MQQNFQQISLLVSFSLYSIFNSRRISRILKNQTSLSKIISQIRQGKKRRKAKKENISDRIQRLISHTSYVISFFLPSTREKKCLFSSSMIFSWSRTQGFDPLLNIGIREGISEFNGHCWLSINDSPFCERSNLHENYSLRLSDSDKIIYWYGDLDAGKERLLKKELKLNESAYNRYL